MSQNSTVNVDVKLGVNKFHVDEGNPHIILAANPDINGINILEPRYHGEVIERLDSGKTYVLALPTCEPSAVQNEYTGQWLDVMKIRAINICVDKKRNTKIAKIYGNCRLLGNNICVIFDYGKSAYGNPAFFDVKQLINYAKTW